MKRGILMPSQIRLHIELLTLIWKSTIDFSFLTSFIPALNSFSRKESFPFYHSDITNALRSSRSLVGSGSGVPVGSGVSLLCPRFEASLFQISVSVMNPNHCYVVHQPHSHSKDVSDLASAGHDDNNPMLDQVIEPFSVVIKTSIDPNPECKAIIPSLESFLNPYQREYYIKPNQSTIQTTYIGVDDMDIHLPVLSLVQLINLYEFIQRLIHNSRAYIWFTTSNTDLESDDDNPRMSISQEPISQFDREENRSKIPIPRTNLLAPPRVSSVTSMSKRSEAKSHSFTKSSDDLDPKMDSSVAPDVGVILNLDESIPSTVFIAILKNIRFAITSSQAIGVRKFLIIDDRNSSDLNHDRSIISRRNSSAYVTVSKPQAMDDILVAMVVKSVSFLHEVRSQCDEDVHSNPTFILRVICCGFTLLVSGRPLLCLMLDDLHNAMLAACSHTSCHGQSDGDASLDSKAKSHEKANPIQWLNDEPTINLRYENLVTSGTYAVTQGFDNENLNDPASTSDIGHNTDLQVIGNQSLDCSHHNVFDAPFIM
jgi:hypothetical protein